MHKVYLLVIALIIIFAVPISESYQLEKTQPEKFKILIVPGHESKSGGAVFLDRKERDMVVVLANELKKKLQDDERFEPTGAPQSEHPSKKRLCAFFVFCISRVLPSASHDRSLP